MKAINILCTTLNLHISHTTASELCNCITPPSSPSFAVCPPHSEITAAARVFGSAKKGGGKHTLFRKSFMEGTRASHGKSERAAVYEMAELWTDLSHA